MAKKLDLEALRTRTADASRGLSAADRDRRQRAAAEAEAAQRAPQSQEGAVPLARITARQGGDTRPLNPEHVLSLAESITALGLIEAIAVDRHHRLLAGGHRLFALRLLAVADPTERLETWSTATRAQALAARPGGRAHLEELRARVRSLDHASFARLFPQGVPVRVHDLDAEAEPQRALQIEVAENEKRRDYTRDEVLKLVDRLRPHGYVIKHGKLKEGEKPLLPELSRVLGKSIRQVQRLLDGVPSTPRRVRAAALPAALAVPASFAELLALIDRSGLGRRQTAEHLLAALRTRSATDAPAQPRDVRADVLAVLMEALDAAQDVLSPEGVELAQRLRRCCST